MFERLTTDQAPFGREPKAHAIKCPFILLLAYKKVEIICLLDYENRLLYTRSVLPYKPDAGTFTYCAITQVGGGYLGPDNTMMFICIIMYVHSQKWFQMELKAGGREFAVSLR